MPEPPHTPAQKMAILSALQKTALRVKRAALKAKHPEWCGEKLDRELRLRFLCLRDDSRFRQAS
jgi:hypothetical protein